MARHRSRGRPPLHDWSRGRRLWDRGWSVREIAAAVGSTPSAVYTYAGNHQWPKRPRPPRVYSTNPATMRTRRYAARKAADRTPAPVSELRWRCQVAGCGALAVGERCVRGHTRDGGAEVAA